MTLAVRSRWASFNVPTTTDDKTCPSITSGQVHPVRFAGRGRSFCIHHDQQCPHRRRRSPMIETDDSGPADRRPRNRQGREGACAGRPSWRKPCSDAEGGARGRRRRPDAGLCPCIAEADAGVVVVGPPPPVAGPTSPNAWPTWPRVGPSSDRRRWSRGFSPWPAGRKSPWSAGDSAYHYAGVDFAAGCRAKDCWRGTRWRSGAGALERKPMASLPRVHASMAARRGGPEGPGVPRPRRAGEVDVWWFGWRRGGSGR